MALAISASAFTGLVIPASADEEDPNPPVVEASPEASPEVTDIPEVTATPEATETPEVTETPTEEPTPEETEEPGFDPKSLIDFTNRSLTYTEKGGSTVFEVVDSVATADATEEKPAFAPALAAAGAGKVLKLGSSQSGAAKYLGYTAPLATTDDGTVMVYSGNVSMSFKLEPMQVRTDKTANMILQFADITKTPILTIDVGTGTNNGITINDKNIATAFGKYYIVEANFDCNNGTATIIVKNADGSELAKQENVKISAEGLSYLYFANTDWRYGYCAIDDIQLDATYVGAPVYYTATFNTERYAKMTTSDKKTYYADVNGKLVVELLKPGTTFDYTISKVGYGDVTGTVAPMEKDLNETKPLTKTDNSALFIESEFGNASEAYVSPGGSRYDSVSLGSYELPETFQLTAKLTYVKAADGQKSWALVTDKGRIAGLQITGTAMKAWTKWTGNKDMNQSDDTDKFGESVNLGPAPAENKEFEVTFVFNTTEKTVTVLYGDINGTMSYDIDATKLTGMDCGLYRNNGELRTNEIKITTPDPEFIVVSGDTKFAKITGKTLTRQYKKVETVIDPDETFIWTAERPNKVTKKGAKFTVEAPEEDMNAKAIIVAYNKGAVKSVKSSDVTIKAGQTEVTVEESADNAVVMLWNSLEGMEPLAPAATVEEYEAIIDDVPGMDGISIDPETGVLSVTDEAAPGVVSVTCTGSSGKTASVDVDIKDFSNVKATADGPDAMEPNKTATYKLTSLKDDYGTDVLDMFAPKFESNNADVIEIDPATGVATAKAAGTAKITVTVGNPGKEANVEIEATVATYSVTTDATGDSTVVDIAAIKEDSAITGYQVTTATAEGVKVAQTTVAKADVADNKITANTAGAAKVEVAPVYETAMAKKIAVPADRYNVTVTATDGKRTDVYVNDQMVFNNINQGSDNWTIGRIFEKSTDYTANDVVIGEGYANFNYRDDQSGASTITKVKFVKSPSIVTRAKRLYVIGDSLTAKYYGTAPEGKEGLVRTGWGEVIGDYLADGVEVTNLGNSGAWAEGMLHDAFTNVKLSGQPGDVLVLESGYNDSSHTTMEVMRESVKAMVKGAEENGMTVFVVTPNASTHSANEYLGSVKSTYDMIVAYNELVEEGSNAVLIDLAYNSGQFFRSYYGDAKYEDENGNIITKIDQFTIPKFDQLNPVYNNSADTLHSTYNAANCWAAVVANGILNNSATASLVNAEYTYTFNDGEKNITVSAANIANADYVSYDVTYSTDDVTVTRPNGATFTKAGAEEMIKVVPKDDTKSVVVTDADENVLLDVKTTSSNGKVTGYYFKMPAKAVTITVESSAATE